MKTTVKKWFKEQGKEFGFLENGSGPDIMVRKAVLVKCQYLKVGATVEFECHIVDKGLIAKHVKLVHEKTQRSNHRPRNERLFGVMT